MTAAGWCYRCGMSRDLDGFLAVWHRGEPEAARLVCRPTVRSNCFGHVLPASAEAIALAMRLPVGVAIHPRYLIRKESQP